MAKKREELLREIEEVNRESNVQGMFLLQAFAERSGMNLTDLQCITILSSAGPITAGRLAEMMGLTTGAITGVVNRLERAGYARREKDPDDARRVLIQPVMAELERMGAGIFSSQGKMIETLFADYDERTLNIFLQIMRKSNAMTREETARIRAASRGEDGGEFSAPLDAVERGRLVFANGAARITLRTDSGIDDLYRARFEGPAPKVTVEDGIVTLRYSGRFNWLIDRRSRSGDVALSDAVPWEIDVRGGTYRLEAHLGGLDLRSFGLSGGESDCTVTLPTPSGVVPVRLSGGASRITMRLPAEVGAGLTMNGGASKLTFDDQHFDVVGGKFRLQSSGYSGAANRYEFDITGGASEITIQHVS